MADSTKGVMVKGDGSVVPDSFFSANAEAVKGAHNHDDRYYTEGEVDTALAGKAAASHTHAYDDLTGKPTLGTAAALNVPASGNAASGEVVKGSDSRLSDARTPTTHNHDDRYYTEGEVDTALAGKAAASHAHAYDDLTGKPTLGTAAALNVPASGDAASGEVVKGSDSRLSDARPPTTHNHDDRYYTEGEVDTALAGKVPTTRSVGASGLASGGGALSADRTIDVPVASQAEAEAGISNAKAMTPLRTAQAITALASPGGGGVNYWREAALLECVDVPATGPTLTKTIATSDGTGTIDISGPLGNHTFGPWSFEQSGPIVAAEIADALNSGGAQESLGFTALAVGDSLQITHSSTGSSVSITITGTDVYSGISDTANGSDASISGTFSATLKAAESGKIHVILGGIIAPEDAVTWPSSVAATIGGSHGSGSWLWLTGPDSTTPKLWQNMLAEVSAAWQPLNNAPVEAHICLAASIPGAFDDPTAACKLRFTVWGITVDA